MKSDTLVWGAVAIGALFVLSKMNQNAVAAQQGPGAFTNMRTFGPGQFGSPNFGGGSPGSAVNQMGGGSPFAGGSPQGSPFGSPGGSPGGSPQQGS